MGETIPESRAFRETHRNLCLYRAKVALIIGIAVVPFFAGLDFFFAREHFKAFLITRLATTVEAGIMLWLIILNKEIGLKFSSFFVSFYCVTVGAILSYMCFKLGGFNSTYYVGIIIVILGASLVMPWHPGYHLFATLGMYASYISQLFFVGMNAPAVTFINNNYFLFAAVAMTYVGSILQYRMHYQKFLADQQILRTNEELKTLDRAKSAFFSNVSHELKTPMTLVLTPLEYALDKAGQEAEQITLSRKSFNAIRHSAYRLSGLISDLLDLTKGQIGKDRIKPASIADTEGFFRDIFQSLVPLMDEKQIQHEFFRSPKQLQPHLFDKTKIDKVVVNLLSNAIKFTPKGGKIVMRIWDEDKEGLSAPVLKFSVSDTGIGIPQEKISKVFERFVQVDDSSTRGYAGLGIGLSLVKDFVEQHGGAIDVESRVGFGTTMIITLPRGREHFRCTVVEDEGSDIGRGIELPTAPKTYMAAESGATEEKKEEAPKEAGRDTILVVDDTLDMRVTLKEILGERFRVVTAEDGVEGYKVAKAERPDLIISDVMMPRRDGYGLILDLKADPTLRAIPVILLTAKVGAENRADGFQHGADDYVEKPFHPKEIVFRVENLLRLNRQARQSPDPGRSP